MSELEPAPADAPRAIRLYAGGEFDFGYLHVLEHRGGLLLRFEGPPGREDVELIIRRDLLERQLPESPP